MAVQFTEYTIGAINLDGTIIHGTDNFSESLQIEKSMLIAGGRISPSRPQTHTAMPRFTFTTPEVNRVLNTAGLFASAGNLGKEISGTVIIYYTRVDALKRSTGADHLTTTINEGIMYPTELSFDGKFWQLTVEILPYSETGATDIFVFGTASLPAFAAIQETYQGGKIKVSTALVPSLTEINCWQDLTLNFGVEAEQRTHKGLSFPTRAHITNIAPTITLSNLNPADRSTFGLYGSRINDLELFLRKHSNVVGDRPTVVADATAEHIRFDAPGGIICPEDVSVSAGQTATQSLMIDLAESTTENVLTPNFNVAIT